MICTRCNKRDGKTPKARFCNLCYQKRFQERIKQKYGITGAYDYSGNKLKVLIRDNFACQLCDKTKNEVQLQIHHIDGNGSLKPLKEQNNDLDNLVTLCPKCHTNVESARRGYPQRSLKALGIWSRLVERCLSCGTDEKKHSRHGLCTTCSERTRREYKAQWYQNKKAA
jgi:5-methylcytosine-specific restriction endonuclease McrA